MMSKSAELSVAVNRALFVPECQRLNEWALIGPVQRAALESFAERLLAAERERLKADAESWGNALNEAGWAATEAYRRHTGQVEPAIFFNHAKGILRDALAAYFKALRA